MRELISQKTLTMLNVLKNKLLMYDDKLFVVKNFTTEKVTVTPKNTIFSSSKPKEKIYLTSIKIVGYNKDGKFIGISDDDWSISFITIYNLYRFRETWENFKEQLKAFGFKITYADETVESAMAKELGISNNES
jgi:hypothetical protein